MIKITAITKNQFNLLMAAGMGIAIFRDGKIVIPDFVKTLNLDINFPIKYPPDKKKKKDSRYSTADLHVIAGALNVLSMDSNYTEGVKMNTFHFTRFSNDTHYIDYHERLKQFRVYRHYKGFKPSRETLRKPK